MTLAPELIMVVGFILAAYSIVGNDSIQTLGTFLYSNSHRPWWVLWIYASSIMIAVMVYGWMNYDQDVSYARLNKVYEKMVSFSDTESHLATLEEELGSAPEGAPEQELAADLAELKEAFKLVKDDYRNSRPGPLDDALVALEGARTSLLETAQRPGISESVSTAIADLEGKVASNVEEIQGHRDVRDFIHWYHLLPPLALLILTRYGFPVSTSFLILITFQPAVFGSMLEKSLMGYVVAFGAAIIIYLTVASFLEKRWIASKDQEPNLLWVLLQWCSTAFLWSMWLIQDMANIFVYLPRPLPAAPWFVGAIIWMVGVQAIIFYTHGGRIQRIVSSKTNTQDVRSATVVDFIYGMVLYYFKIQSNIPMSTTWVFLGLLAGRELAISLVSRDLTVRNAVRLAGIDIFKAGTGLAVSVLIALLINQLK